MKCEDFRWKAHLYLDDDLEPAQRARFTEHCDRCTECAAYLEQLRVAGNLLRDALALEESQRQAASIRARIRSAIAKERAISLFGRRLAIPRPIVATAMAMPVAVILCVAIYGAVLPGLIRNQGVKVYAPAQFAANSMGVVKVTAQDDETGEPLSGVPIRLAAFRPNLEHAIWTELSHTDDTGMASVPIRVPDLDNENMRIEVAASLPGEPAVVQQYVPVYRDMKLLLTTDKPTYEPGEQLRVQVVALQMPTRKPVHGEQVGVTVTDARGHRAFRESRGTSADGAISSTFQLPENAGTGTYRVSAEMGDVKSERTVQVRTYVPPKFDVRIETQREFYTPDHTLNGTVVVTRPSGGRAGSEGKPVGEARVFVTLEATGFRAETTRQRIFGRTSSDGTLKFSRPLRELFVSEPARGAHGALVVAATVADSTGDEERTRITRPMASQAVDISFVPKGGKLIRGRKSVVYVLTTYPDGRPAECDVTVRSPELKRRWSEKSGKTGVLPIQVESPEGSVTLRATARDARGDFGEREQKLNVYYDQHLVIVPSAVIYEIGSRLHADIYTGQPEGAILVDITRHEQTVLVKSLALREGKAALDVDLTDDFAGTLILHVYWSGDASDTLGDTAVVFVNPVRDLRQVAFRPEQQAALLGLDEVELKPHWAGGESLQPKDVICGLISEPGQEWVEKRASVLMNAAKPESPKLFVTDDSGMNRLERARDRREVLLGVACAGLAAWSLVLVSAWVRLRRYRAPRLKSDPRNLP